MAQSFLEFFEKIQENQIVPLNASRIERHKAHAQTKLDDADVSHENEPPVPEEVKREGYKGGEGHEVSTNGCHSHENLAIDDELHPDVGEEAEIPDWNEIKQSSRLGPLLSSLRKEQQHRPEALQESYSIDHLKRLYQFVPRKPYSKPRANKLCSKEHPKPCPYGCKSCHFCRQRTTEVKTVCSLCEGKNNYYGGPARGYWCGSCLWLRIGENIDEVRQRSDWVCPACRDICNCSGANCMRIKRGWFPTQQLSHEARDQGYKSVAHYLVLTHLSEKASAAPLALPAPGKLVSPQMVRNMLTPDDMNTEEDVIMNRRRRRQLKLSFEGHKARRKTLEKVSASRLQQELAALSRDLASQNQVLDQIIQAVEKEHNEAKNAVDFLCILDEDMKEDDEDDDQNRTYFDNDVKVNSPGNMDGNVRVASFEGGRLLYNSVDAPPQISVDHFRPDPTEIRAIMPPKYPEGASKRSLTSVGGKYTSGQGRQAALGQEIADPSASKPTSSKSYPQYEDPKFFASGANLVLDSKQIEKAEKRKTPPADISATTSKIQKQGLSWERSAIQVENFSDEYIWNDLCLQASSVVDMVRTFYNFHPDAMHCHGGSLVDPAVDRTIYENMFDHCHSILQSVLRRAEALALHDVTVPYGPDSPTLAESESSALIGSLKTPGGVRRAFDLLTYLARVLPESDVKWRIEKRVLGFEPMVNFERSNPHTKAIILKGRMDLSIILQKRAMGNSEALKSLGDAFASIASEMQAVVPLLDTILGNKPIPEIDFAVCGWRLDSKMRDRKIIDIFADLSVLYSLLYEVLLSSLRRVESICYFWGGKSYYLFTEKFISTFFSNKGTFPKRLLRESLVLLCTILSIGFETVGVRNDDLSAEARNTVLEEHMNLVRIVKARIVPVLESLIQEDYNMWGKQKYSPAVQAHESKVGVSERVGTEKIEALARSLALLLRAGECTWSWVESKATEPYSFVQFWKYANLTYRHFALYLLAHTLQHAPLVLEIEANLPSILRMWLLSVLDWGKHKCSWYLTTTLAAKLRHFFPNLQGRIDLDYRNDSEGKKRSEFLHHFAEKVLAHGNQVMFSSIVLNLDEFLSAREKEIAQSAFHPESALSKWQFATARSLLGLLQGAGPILGNHSTLAVELRKLTRRLAAWFVESFCSLKQREDVQRQASDLGLEEFSPSGIDGSLLKTEADVREELSGNILSLLTIFLPILEELRESCLSAENQEFLEPLWVLVAGMIEFGSASPTPDPVDRVVYDKVAASMVMAQDARSAGSARIGKSVPLHIFVMATFVRRYVVRASYRHRSNENFAINALRLAHAIMSRSELRAKERFQVAFDTMIPVFLNIISRDREEISPTLRDSMNELLTLVLQTHPSMIPHPRTIYSGSKSLVYESFWSAICQESLAVVSCRFPATLLSSVALDSEFLYCRLLQNFSELNHFVPVTKAALIECHNIALSELGRPMSLQIVEGVYASCSLGEIIPRAFSKAALPAMLQSRHDQLGWTAASNAIDFIRKIMTVASSTMDVTAEVSLHRQTPGLWYGLSCFPYLYSLMRSGSRTIQLLQEQYDAYEKAVEILSPEFVAAVRNVFATPLPASIPVQTSVKVETDETKPQIVDMTKEEDVVMARKFTHLSQLNEHDIGDIVSCRAKILKVRRLERNNVEVAVCNLGPSDRSENKEASANLLISKPLDLLKMVLSSQMMEKLPCEVEVENVELVRKQAQQGQITVIRSTTSTRISMDMMATLTPKDASYHLAPGHCSLSEVKTKLMTMGYRNGLVNKCLETLQEECAIGRLDPNNVNAVVARAIDILTGLK